MSQKLAQKLASDKGKAQARDLAKFMDFVSGKRRQSTDWRKWSVAVDREDEERYVQQLAGHVSTVLGLEQPDEIIGFELANWVYEKMVSGGLSFLPHFQSLINFLEFIEEKKSISLNWLDWPTGRTALIFDETQGTVILDTKEEAIQLTPHQGTIMGLLVDAGGDPVSADEIGRALYGNDDWYSGKEEGGVLNSAIERQVGRLRESLGESAARAGYIRTKRGAGWYLNRMGGPDEWRRGQELAMPVEIALGTDHYDEKTCTGLQFAVRVYNEIAETPLEIY